MSNGSARPPARSGLPPLLIAAGALIVYFLIISRWQAVPTPETVEQSSATRDGAPQLELSRRLSTPTGEAVISASASETSWLWPIAAFVPPLLIGMLWGSARVSGADKELFFTSTHLRVPEAAGDRWDTEINGAGVGERADRTAPALDDAPPVATAVPEAVVSEAEADAQGGSSAHAAADDLPADVESLRAALRARDEVIFALEEIVRENRDSWANHEGSASKQAKTITALQADLDAANRIIDLLQMSDSERTRLESPRPQIMERS